MAFPSAAALALSSAEVKKPACAGTEALRAAERCTKGRLFSCQSPVFAVAWCRSNKRPNRPRRDVGFVWKPGDDSPAVRSLLTRPRKQSAATTAWRAAIETWISSDGASWCSDANNYYPASEGRRARRSTIGFEDLRHFRRRKFLNLMKKKGKLFWYLNRLRHRCKRWLPARVAGASGFGAFSPKKGPDRGTSPAGVLTTPSRAEPDAIRRIKSPGAQTGTPEKTKSFRASRSRVPRRRPASRSRHAPSTRRTPSFPA